MKHGIFRFIDESASYLVRYNDIYEKEAKKLERFFTDSFSWRDSFINVHTRIKSEKSLREKILRQNLFSKYEKPEELLRGLHDLIGVRIECRFIAEEKELYEALLDVFTDEMDNGYFASPLNANIRLDLNKRQPRIQKNGFEIYRIDGQIHSQDSVINFELQIKSLVNIFWGEIDHKVFYKNFNYMLGEDFLRDMLTSIKENLWSIDKRLMQMYRHIEAIDGGNPDTTKAQLKALLSKLIHDVYIMKLREQTGVLFDFKKPSNLIVDFIFSKKQSLPEDRYAVFFLQTISKVQSRQRTKLDFTTGIKYKEFEMESNLENHLKEALLPYINRDFKWYLLFRILLDVEQRYFEEEFQAFISYLISTMSYRIQKGLFVVNISDIDRKKTFEKLLEITVFWYSQNCDLNFLTIDNMRALEESVRIFMENVERPEDLLDLDEEDFIYILEDNIE